MFLRFVFACALVFGLSSPALALPDWLCDWIPPMDPNDSAIPKGSAPSCPAETYLTKHNCICVDCSKEGAITVIQDRCNASHEPPQAAKLDCYRGQGEFSCEAWPQGKGLTYTWRASDGVQLLETGTTTSPLQAIECVGNAKNAVVSVTVASPYALGTTSSFSVNCSGTQDR